MEEILRKFYEWGNWEGIMHNVLLLLILYVMYLFVVSKKDRTLTNILLFTIIISVDTLIHQNINIRNNEITNYNF